MKKMKNKKYYKIKNIKDLYILLYNSIELYKTILFPYIYI